MVKESKDNEQNKEPKVWASFTDDDGKTIKGFFYLVEKTEGYVTLKSIYTNSKTTLPWNKIDKLKEKEE